jgi:hypothetical protein
LKLQKLENWKNRSIEELLGEAQKTYVRREEEKQNQKAKIMLSMISRLVGKGQTNILLDVNRPGLPHGYKRPESQKMKQRRGENKCFKCEETGYFKRECPEERECRKLFP